MHPIMTLPDLIEDDIFKRRKFSISENNLENYYELTKTDTWHHIII